MPSQTVATSATTSPPVGTIPASHLHALLGAYNATALASAYLERGNLKAARRKLVLALRDVDALAAADAGTCASKGGAA